MEIKLVEAFGKVVKESMPELVATELVTKLDKADQDAAKVEMLEANMKAMKESYDKERKSTLDRHAEELDKERRAATDATKQLSEYLDKNEDLEGKEGRLKGLETSLEGRDRAMTIKEATAELVSKHNTERVHELKIQCADLMDALKHKVTASSSD